MFSTVISIHGLSISYWLLLIHCCGFLLIVVVVRIVVNFFVIKVNVFY